ncbi:[ThiS-adenylate] sulfurtransferase [Tamilnaduibacter salinus]|uniref:tRNA sulfurtransferase n=1 Tax=Tamilnaduibacter salinus TaxID=1484056 RepID=A0A2U1CWF4_9GAMM|nr:tRNA uracil 4-sulfurtransferase ThiI [Tamilnaduibacter salinus]PVY76296.1 [ThiS-adenylate] sulfurtransferase [Tamilnaduibacter salinus]
MKFLIRPFAETAIKSRPVRQQQVRQLRRNVRRILARLDDRVQVQGGWDRVDVQLPDDGLTREQVITTLQRVPGISNIQVIREYPLDCFETIADIVVSSFEQRLAGKSFAVRVRRSGKHDFSSQDLEKYLGGALLRRTDARAVNLNHPDEPVRLEVIGDYFHVVDERFEGMGGYPMGAVENAMTLISGGYDSSVATYLNMRRGIRTHFLFFDLGGTAHETGVKQVAWHLWSRYGSSHSVHFITVPFEEVVGEIMRSVNNRYWGVTLKRVMLRAASAIAGETNAQALVTGDSVAQVSSQTLTNINVIDRASEQVVLRPLINMDKGEIIRLAGEIETDEFARNMPEYCGVISSKPVTRAKVHRAEEEEAKMDPAVLAKAIEDRVATPIHRLMETLTTPEEVELVRTPSLDDVIIDVRHPTEEERAPLHLTNNEILHIPFYELSQHLSELASDRRYLLYCDRGTMSRMHAGQLQAEGLPNVQVYAP